MSSAAVTLQCPACGGVFLTLQQGTGEPETCPHCSQSAPVGRYYTIEAKGGLGSHSELPPQHTEHGKIPLPPATSAAQLWEAALLRQQQQAQHPAPAFTGTESVKIGAPATLQTPTPTLPPPASTAPRTFDPVVSLDTGPLPPPQIGFVPPATSELTPTVFPPHPHGPAPAPVALPVSPFGNAGTGTDAADDPAEPPPLPAPPGLSVHIAPPLPGAVPHHEHAVNPHHHEASAHAAPHAAQDLALVAVKMMRNSGPPTVIHHPPSRAPWIAGLIFGSLALAGGLHLIKKRLHPTGTSVTPDIAQHGPSFPRESKSTPLPESKENILPQQPMAAISAENVPEPMPAPTPAPSTASPQAPSQVAATTTVPPAAPEMEETRVVTTTKPEGMPSVPSSEIATIPVPTTPPSPPSPPASAPEPAAPQEEVRRALPSNAATLSISKQDPLPVIAAKLVFGIDSATTPEERARWIADPVKHGADMEQLVKQHGGRLNTREVEPLPIPGPVHALPSREAVSLFRVNTPASRGGAMVRLHATANGNHVIDWPLFAQTYDNAFDHFIAANRISPAEAEWYTVLCNLIADPSMKNAREEPRLLLKVQGSLAETGVTEAWVDKNSPAGQYLQKEMIHGGTYLVELQLSTSDKPGPRLKVLDSAATKGEPAQANANK